jgi:signal transduction histidine kinase/ActR/RegA family two-component response regulator
MALNPLRKRLNTFANRLLAPFSNLWSGRISLSKWVFGHFLVLGIMVILRFTGYLPNALVVHIPFLSEAPSAGSRAGGDAALSVGQCASTNGTHATFRQFGLSAYPYPELTPAHRPSKTYLTVVTGSCAASLLSGGLIWFMSKLLPRKTWHKLCKELLVHLCAEAVFFFFLMNPVIDVLLVSADPTKPSVMPASSALRWLLSQPLLQSIIDNCEEAAVETAKDVTRLREKLLSATSPETDAASSSATTGRPLNQFGPASSGHDPVGNHAGSDIDLPVPAHQTAQDGGGQGATRLLAQFVSRRLDKLDSHNRDAALGLGTSLADRIGVDAANIAPAGSHLEGSNRPSPAVQATLRRNRPVDRKAEAYSNARSRAEDLAPKSIAAQEGAAAVSSLAEHLDPRDGGRVVRTDLGVDAANAGNAGGSVLSSSSVERHVCWFMVGVSIWCSLSRLQSGPVGLLMALLSAWLCAHLWIFYNDGVWFLFFLVRRMGDMRRAHHDTIAFHEWLTGQTGTLASTWEGGALFAAKGPKSSRGGKRKQVRRGTGSSRPDSAKSTPRNLPPLPLDLRAMLIIKVLFAITSVMWVFFELLYDTSHLFLTSYPSLPWIWATMVAIAETMVNSVVPVFYVINRALIVEETRSSSERVAFLTAKAVSAARAKSSQQWFLRYLLHEVRIPANSIRLGLEHLSTSENLSRDEKESLGYMTTAVESMACVLNSVLTLSALEAHRFYLDWRVGDLRESTFVVLRQLQPWAAGIGATLTFSVDPLLPPLLRFDPQRIMQALTNLVSNGLKHVPQNGEGVVCIRIAVVGFQESPEPSPRLHQKELPQAMKERPEPDTDRHRQASREEEGIKQRRASIRAKRREWGMKDTGLVRTTDGSPPAALALPVLPKPHRAKRVLARARSVSGRDEQPRRPLRLTILRQEADGGCGRGTPILSPLRTAPARIMIDGALLSSSPDSSPSAGSPLQPASRPDTGDTETSGGSPFSLTATPTPSDAPVTGRVSGSVSSSRSGSDMESVMDERGSVPGVVQPLHTVSTGLQGTFAAFRQAGPKLVLPQSQQYSYRELYPSLQQELQATAAENADVFASSAGDRHASKTFLSARVAPDSGDLVWHRIGSDVASSGSSTASSRRRPYSRDVPINRAVWSDLDKSKRPDPSTGSIGEGSSLRGTTVTAGTPSVCTGPCDSLPILLSLHRQALVHIAVEDNGPGIPASQIGTLFKDPFSRIRHENESLSKPAGSGLGLFIAKQIVEAHGGTISVDSVEGKGSIFAIDIPLDMYKAREPATNEQTGNDAGREEKEEETPDPARRDSDLAEPKELEFKENPEEHTPPEAAEKEIRMAQSGQESSTSYHAPPSPDLIFASTSSPFDDSVGRIFPHPFRASQQVAGMPEMSGMAAMATVGAIGAAASGRGFHVPLHVSAHDLSPSTEETHSRLSPSTASYRTTSSRNVGARIDISPSTSSSLRIDERERTHGLNGQAVDGAQTTPVRTQRMFLFPSLTPSVGCVSEAGELPMPVSTVDATHLMQPGPASASTASAFPKAFLIIDDEATNRKLLARVLRSRYRDARFAEAADGVSALDVLASEGYNAFDVIIIDANMPRMNGYQAVQEMRQRGTTGLVIGVTGEAMEDERRRFLELGCSVVLLKPISGDKITSAIADWKRSTSDCGPPLE